MNCNMAIWAESGTSYTGAGDCGLGGESIAGLGAKVQAVDHILLIHGSWPAPGGAYSMTAGGRPMW